MAIMHRATTVLLFATLITAGLSAPSLAAVSREVALIERLGKQSQEPASSEVTLTDVLAAARTVDDYVEANYRKHGVKPTMLIRDDVFLRRIYLDLAGRIPTLQEIHDFRRTSGNRRAAVIDKLLDSEAYVSNYFNFWADILRVQTSMRGNGAAYAEWLKDALRTNMPYDEFVYELITAEGYTWENGAAGYHLRDAGMPLDNMANTMQVFLGTSLVCAQCHDHPFDKWSQREFYEMAAYSFGVNTRMRAPNVEKAKRMVKDPMVRRTLDNMTRALSYGVSYEPNRMLRLPHDYKYDDASPRSPVEPFTIFGDKAIPGDGKTPKQVYAEWITSSRNPRFTMVIANRLFKQVVGTGLFEPIDEIMDDTEPAIPELMAFLTYKMIDYDYDVKQYLRVLYNTKLYQRAVTVEDRLENEPEYFTGHRLHRMTAEQFWDSLMTLVIPEVDHRKSSGSARGRYGYASEAAALQAASPEELVAMAQAMTEYEQQRRDLDDKIAEARKANNKKAVEQLYARRKALKRPKIAGMMGSMMEMEMDGEAAEGGSDIDASIWNGYPGDFKRASELGSPSRYGSFLRMFGQSDREVIENASTEPNMLQVLAMFNGRMFEEVMHPRSQVMKNINAVKSPAAKIEVIFMSLLNRPPDARERKIALQSVGGGNDYGRVVWALLNTREFSFVQ